MGHAKDLTGKRFGRLVAVRPSHQVGTQWHWEYKCDCGATIVRHGAAITVGKQVSCGCYMRERAAVMCRSRAIVCPHGVVGRRSCRICRPAQQRNNILLRAYGVGHAQYEEMRLQQQSRCAVCQQIPTTRLHIDHCHATGKVRGLLCGNCNTGLGLFGDSPERLAAAIAYLKLPQEKANAQ